MRPRAREVEPAIMSGGLRVRTGLRVPSRPPIGSEAQQLRRLDHARDRHGFRAFACGRCLGEGCDSCAHLGYLAEAGDMEPCGPDCLLREVIPS